MPARPRRPKRQWLPRYSMFSKQLPVFGAALVLGLILWLHGQQGVPLEQVTMDRTNTIMEESSKVSSVDPVHCEEAVKALVSRKIQLAAFDFDATIVDIHTGGRWKGNATVLASHVRPEFQCFITQCLEHGLDVAVATFSTQVDLIEAVLQQTIPHTRVKTIVVYGGNAYVEHHSKGKQSQLLLAKEHFDKMRRRKGQPALSRQSTILIDDDNRNIRIARKDGYQTIEFLPDEPESLFRLTSTAI